MYHPKMVEFDNSMKAMFDRIDSILEDTYHGKWKIRRNRPKRGETSNPEADGLFNIGTIFTPGYGSSLGRGYLVEIIVATEENVTSEVHDEIERIVKDLIEGFLPEYFPGRKLEVERDGSMLKIFGDLSLGTL